MTLGGKLIGYPLSFYLKSVTSCETCEQSNPYLVYRFRNKFGMTLDVDN